MSQQAHNNSLPNIKLESHSNSNSRIKLQACPSFKDGIEKVHQMDSSFLRESGRGNSLLSKIRSNDIKAEESEESSSYDYPTFEDEAPTATFQLKNYEPIRLPPISQNQLNNSPNEGNDPIPTDTQTQTMNQQSLLFPQKKKPTAEQVKSQILAIFQELKTASEAGAIKALEKNLQQKLIEHIIIQFHPSPLDDIGSLLLSDGLFVREYIVWIASQKDQVGGMSKKKMFLIRYLFEQFEGQIKTNQQDFAAAKEEIIKLCDAQSAEIPLYESRNYQNENLSNCHTSQIINQSMMAQVDQHQNRSDISHSKQAEKIEKGKNIVSKQSKKEEPKRKEELIKRVPKKINNYEKSRQPQKKPTMKRPVAEGRALGAILKNGSKQTVNPVSKQKVGRPTNDQRSARMANNLNTYPSKHLSHQSPIRAVDVDHDSNLGSKYKYQIIVNKNSQEKALTTVRVSARLQQKEKKEYNPESQRSKSKRKNTMVQNVEDESIEELLNVDYLKDHLPEINFKNVTLYRDFKALHEKDKEITEFLMKMQEQYQPEDQRMGIPLQIENNVEQNQIASRNESQEIQQPQPQQNGQLPQQSNQLPPRISQSQLETSQNSFKMRRHQFQQSKQKFKLEQLPLTIANVVCPNVNNHNIYALLQLGKITQFEMGTRYALTPLTNLMLANKRHILEDLQTAKQIVGDQWKDNIGYVAMNSQTLRILNDETKKVENEVTN